MVLKALTLIESCGVQAYRPLAAVFPTASGERHQGDGLRGGLAALLHHYRR